MGNHATQSIVSLPPSRVNYGMRFYGSGISINVTSRDQTPTSYFMSGYHTAWVPSKVHDWGTPAASLDPPNLLRRARLGASTRHWHQTHEAQERQGSGALYPRRGGVYTNRERTIDSFTN